MAAVVTAEDRGLGAGNVDLAEPERYRSAQKPAVGVDPDRFPGDGRAGEDQFRGHVLVAGLTADGNLPVEVHRDRQVVRVVTGQLSGHQRRSVRQSNTGDQQVRVPDLPQRRALPEAVKDTRFVSSFIFRVDSPRTGV